MTYPKYYTEEHVSEEWSAVENFFQIDTNTAVWLFAHAGAARAVTFDMVINRMKHILAGGEPSTF